MIRLGLCCLFRDQPIKFVTTTATSIGKMKRPDALAKLSRLCMENAGALLAALRFCAANGIGCFASTAGYFRSKRIRPMDTRSMICLKAMKSFAASRTVDNSFANTSCEPVFTRTSSWC